MTEQPMPGIKEINGRYYIKVQDLAHDWHTTTSSILATGKPRQVPAKYRRTIDGCTWCDVEGLRYRLNMMKRGGKIREQLRQLVDRFPKPSFKLTGPLEETVPEKNGTVSIIRRSTFQNIDLPSQGEMQDALKSGQIIYRYKNGCVQVLAQTLSNYLGTRTSSLLAVNKKQGVPSEFIHREWKRTWVNLDGLKKRVAQTGHSSDLLEGLKLVIEAIDAVTTPDDSRVELSSVEQKKQQAKPKAKAGTKHNPIDVCEVAVEANKRAVHNTGRINKLDRDEAALENLMFSTRGAVSTDLGTQSKRLDMFADRVHRIECRLDDIEAAEESASAPQSAKPKQKKQQACPAVTLAYRNSADIADLSTRVHDLDTRATALELDMPQLLKELAYHNANVTSLRGRVDRIEKTDKQATEAAVNQTLLRELHTRLGRVATQADSLDSRTEGMDSRISVVEDTSKWLSWTLAGVIGLRFLGLMVRWLKRK